MIRNRAVARAVIVALLLSSLLLASTRSADAAVTYGTSGSAVLTWDKATAPGIDPWWSTANCVVSGQWKSDAGSLSVNYAVACTGSWNLQLRESGSSGGLAFLGSDGCSYSGRFDVSKSGDTYRAKGGAGASTGTTSACSPSQVCVDLARGDGPTYPNKCAAISLGDPPGVASDGTCAYGNVTKPAADAARWWSPDGYWPKWWGVRFSSSLTQTAALPAPMSGGSSTSNWTFYVLWSNYDASPSSYFTQLMWDGQQTYGNGKALGGAAIGVGSSTGPTVPWLWDFKVSDSFYSDGTPPGGKGTPDAKIIGAGWYLNRTGAASTKPATQPGGMMGVTDPGQCAWYWGPKVFDAPNSTIDDPAGGFTQGAPAGGGGSSTPQPDPDPPAAPTNGDGCGNFSVLDPSTWAGSAMCIVAKLLSDALSLLGNLLGLIGGLVVDLVTKLGDLLRTLFTPHPETWGWEDMTTSFKTRAPFSFLSSGTSYLTSTVDTFSSPGACAAALQYSNENPMITCAGIRDAPTAQTVRGFSTFALIVLTAWTVVAQVRGSLGGRE